MKPWVVVYNRRSKPEPTEMGVAKCVCVSSSTDPTGVWL